MDEAHIDCVFKLIIMNYYILLEDYLEETTNYTYINVLNWEDKGTYLSVDFRYNDANGLSGKEGHIIELFQLITFVYSKIN